MMRQVHPPHSPAPQQRINPVDVEIGSHQRVGFRRGAIAFLRNLAGQFRRIAADHRFGQRHRTRIADFISAMRAFGHQIDRLHRFAASRAIAMHGQRRNGGLIVCHGNEKLTRERAQDTFKCTGSARIIQSESAGRRSFRSLTFTAGLAANDMIDPERCSDPVPAESPLPGRILPADEVFLNIDPRSRRGTDAPAHRPPGPGIWESIAWMTGVHVVQSVALVVASSLLIVASLVAMESREIDKVVADLADPNAMMTIVGGFFSTNLFYLAAAAQVATLLYGLAAIRLRCGRTGVARLGWHFPWRGHWYSGCAAGRSPANPLRSAPRGRGRIHAQCRGAKFRSDAGLGPSPPAAAAILDCRQPGIR